MGVGGAGTLWGEGEGLWETAQTQLLGHMRPEGHVVMRLCVCLSVCLSVYVCVVLRPSLSLLPPRNLRKGSSGLADEINFEDFLTPWVALGNPFSKINQGQ